MHMGTGKGGERMAVTRCGTMLVKALATVDHESCMRIASEHPRAYLEKVWATRSCTAFCFTCVLFLKKPKLVFFFLFCFLFRFLFLSFLPSPSSLLLSFLLPFFLFSLFYFLHYYFFIVGRMFDWR